MVSMKPVISHMINQSTPYAIKNPSETIHFVASKDKWAYCESRLRKAVVMGFDTGYILLQIAVRDAENKEEVFVLDLLTMPPKMYNSTLSEVFLSKNILKLGQGFYQDLKELAQSYPKASCFRVAKSVVEVNDLSISLVGSHHPLSLQKLVFLYLHRKLTKTQQTSNWNRRPLAPSQLHYAAADALVLIHLYDELMKLMAAKRDDFQLESVMNVLDVHVPPAPKCNLCFECFDSLKTLKAHRKICAQNVRTLDICVSCDEKKLMTPAAMQQHVSECSEAGSEGGSRAMVTTTTQQRTVASRKRSLSVTETDPSIAPPVSISAVPAPKEKVNKNKTKAKGADDDILQLMQIHIKKKKKTKAIVTEDEPECVNPDDRIPLSKSSKKRKRKKVAEMQQIASDSNDASTVPLRKRKMSVESSLLASDDIWSKVSTDYNSSLFSP
ncbi:Exonuclease family protein, partial [Globisporangium splendens]